MQIKTSLKYLVPVYLFSAGLLLITGCTGSDPQKTETSKVDTLTRDTSVATQQHPDKMAKADTAMHPEVEHIRRQLLKVFKDDLKVITDNDRKFTFEHIDLNGDHKKEIFVGFNGAYFCGSGGCTALLLSSSGGLLSRFTVAEYPFIVLNSATNGWRDLLVGTAAVQPSLRVLKWNGKKYPGNPSTQPEFTLPVDAKSKYVFNFETYDEQWFDF